MRKAQLFRIWEQGRSSFWFLPGLLAIGAMVLATVTVAIDKGVTDWLLLNWGWTFTGGADGASTVLGTVAGSMITIAGVVFSMTLVALSLASSQLGPRLLRNFLRDTTTQVVLGTFVAIFLYCLLVLRTIRRAEENLFVPHLSVTVGVLLAIVGVAVLIYYIHHVSVSVQANSIVARVGRELLDGIERLFPEQIGSADSHEATVAPDADFLAWLEREGLLVESVEDGYLQYIDGDALMALAEEEDLVLKLERRPGQYVTAGGPLVLACPGDRVTEEMVERINRAFVLGDQRTSSQDIEFSINQIVEVAVRALSPGVNDPFTAMTCVDHLGSGLCRLARREMPSPRRRVQDGRQRVIAPAVTFGAVADTAFEQIRQYGRSSVAVTIRLLETIATIAHFVRRPEDRVALVRHADMIVRGARAMLPEDDDRQAVETCYQEAIRALEHRRVGGPGPGRAEDLAPAGDTPG